LIAASALALPGWGDCGMNGAAISAAVNPPHEALMSFLAELWAFMRARKKFWLVPVLIMMVIFGGLVVMTKGSVVAPFIYTIF
jgi:Family of unknown function (DUF5989)